MHHIYPSIHLNTNTNINLWIPYLPYHSHPLTYQAIQTARQEKQFSQKDLAQKVNEKPSVIQDYESGKAIPNPQILGKLERTLGVKLRGANIGEKLGGPKKS